MKSGLKEMIFSFTLHVAAFAAIFFFSARSSGEPVISAADPLMAMLADPDADPTKAAGLINEKRGLADGSLDGNTLKGIDSELKRMNQAAEEALAKPLPESEKPTPAEPSPVEPTPASPVSSSPEKADPVPPAPVLNSPKEAETSRPQVPGRKTSFEEWRRQANKTSGNSGKEPTAHPKAGSGNSGVGVAKIDVGKIGIGSGKTFGVPGGTGGNGGEGGRAVASAQQAYAAEVAGKLATHLDNVLAQSPLKLEATVSVTVRLGVDARGNIRLLEILGYTDAQVRDRVEKAVSRLGKFRSPPEGRAFELRIPDVILRPL